MTEYEPYGVRHFLREGDPEGASELRRRPVLLRSGRQLEKLEVADVDELALDALLVYRTLVLRRSPVASRPPSIYRQRAQRPLLRRLAARRRDRERAVLEHLPLGYGALRRRARALRRRAAARRPGAHAGRPAGVRAAARAATRVPLSPPRRHATGSADPAEPGAVIPSGDAGTAPRRCGRPRPGTYDAYVRGSFRGRLQLAVDGREVASERHRLSHVGPVRAARHPSRLTRGPARGRDRLRDRAAPARQRRAGAQPRAALLRRRAPRRTWSCVRPARARSLCDRSLDWVEAVVP